MKKALYIKPLKSQFIILEVVFGFALLLLLYGSISIKDFGVPSIMLNLIVVGIMVWFFWIYKKMYIQVSDNLLTYKIAFEKPIIIKINTIEAAWMEYGVPSKRGQPYARLIIYPREYTGIEQFYISSEGFEREGMKELIKMLPMTAINDHGFIGNVLKKVIEYDDKKRTSKIIKPK